MSEASPPIRAVCVGLVELMSGKLASYWMPEEAIPSEGRVNLAGASIFGGNGWHIGGIYEGPGKVGENGTLESWAKSPRFIGQKKGDWEAERFHARGMKDKAKAEALERRLKANDGAMREVRQLAAILAKVPLRQRFHALQSIMGVISEEAIKAGRGR